MSTEFAAKCRGPRCGKRIVMRTDDKGRPHPYDVPPRCPDCKGSGILQTTTADMFGSRTVSAKCRKCRGVGRLWVSHFKTCVDADVFRGKAEVVD